MDPTQWPPGLTINSMPFRPTSMPPQPDLPTPMSQQDYNNAETPLPSWIPLSVQHYINQAPSFAEGQRQTTAPPPDITGGEPYSPTPQIDDIRRLFARRQLLNSATPSPIGGKLLRDFILGGHLGGGNEI